MTTNEITVEGPKVTIAFERSVQVRDYESAKASIYLTVPTSPEDLIGDQAEVLTRLADKIKPTFAVAKATVFEQLGIPAQVDPTDLVVKELLERALGAVEVTPAQEQVAIEAAGQSAVSANPPVQTSRGGGTPAPTTKQGLWEEVANEPKKWFDNRTSKKSAAGPDFKRKYTGETLWLDYKGQSNVPEGLTIPDASAF